MNATRTRGGALGVVHLERVSAVDPVDSQWVEFALGQRYLQSSYGIIYVPEGHDPVDRLGRLGALASLVHWVRQRG